MIRPPQRRTVAALTLSAAALVGIVLHEGYTDRAVIPVKGDVPTIGFGTTTGVKLGDRLAKAGYVATSLRTLRRIASSFLAAHGPIKTTFAFGLCFLIRRAVNVIGVSAMEIQLA